MKHTTKSTVALFAIVLLVAVTLGYAQKIDYSRYSTYYYGPGKINQPAGDVYRAYYPYTQYAYTPNYVIPYYGNFDQAAPSYTYPYYRYTYAHPYYGYYFSEMPASYTYSSPRAPSKDYPSGVYKSEPRGMEGQLCGLLDGKQYGCEFGLVCDYRISEPSIGVCSR
jgi:hypothetical protein